MLGPCCGDGYVAQMTPTILYHMIVLALVQLGDRLLGVEGQQVGVRGVDQERGEMGGVVEDKDKGINDYDRQVEA